MSRRGNGEGTITRHKASGRWMAQLTTDTGKRRTYYGATRAEVQAKLQTAQTARAAGTLAAEPGQRVGDYLDGWLRTARQSIRPRTYDSYALNVRRLQGRIGGVRLEMLRPAHLQQCYTELLETGLSARSVQQAHVVLHCGLEQAVRLGLVPRNVADAVTPPRPARKEMKTLTVGQVATLLDVSGEDRFHAMWALLATTGLRLGEALGLKWKDIDLDAGMLRVRRQLQRRRGGGGLVLDDVKSATSRRPVHLGSVACQALRRLQTQQKEQRLAAEPWIDMGLVFTTITGTPVEQGRVHKHFVRTLARAELPRVRLHDLRHTAASLMLEQGENPKVVQEMLGHSSITLTLGTYSHVLPAMHRGAADRLDARLQARSS